ncbi:MAG: D-alanine--D-alanine ligase [Gammaproteobacteria bacterium]|nr:D-alanine--D-alanine ligase [Gammaproteobacteria bacterium]
MTLEQLQDARVAVLQGGDSPEREVSLMSGASVEAALQELGVATIAVDTALPRWWNQLQQIDLAFICLHGPGGEDGVVQGALETMAIPYTGSGVLASALAMDKLRSKRLWRGIGLATQDFEELAVDSDWQAVIDRLGSVFVKPATGGSSIGTAGANTAESLAAAWQQAAQYGDRVIAERLIEGGEYTVAILDGQALPAIKMETDNEFYDYQAKYLSDATRYLCPCGLSSSEEAELAQLALLAFESLGCAGWGRVDFMRDQQGNSWVLEVNTVPGMTHHSLVPMAAAARGLSLPELVGRIACLSLVRN